MSGARKSQPDAAAAGHRRRLVELDDAACWDRLGRAFIGRIIRIVRGEAEVSVVSIGLDDGAVVMRSTTGTRLSATLASPGVPAVLEVDDLDAQTGTGWSVVARGTLTPVLGLIESTHLDRTQPPSWLLGDTEGTWVRFDVTRMTGRELIDPRAS